MPFAAASWATGTGLGSWAVSDTSLPLPGDRRAHPLTLRVLATVPSQGVGFGLFAFHLFL